MQNEQTDTNGGNAGAARGPRSPNFPSLTLADALLKVRLLYEKDRRTPVSTATVMSHLGFNQKVSGSSARVLSAMRQFGLLEQDDKGQCRVTELATRIITLSDGAPERTKALKEAVWKPRVYRDIFTAFADGLPSDPALRDYLILRQKFNPDSVAMFLRMFRASIEFAKVAPGAYTEPANEHTTTPPPSDLLGVGDYVQWESQGVLRFDAPRKVTSKSPDGDFIFVEGTTTGIPVDQVRKAEPPIASVAASAFQFQKTPSGVVREVSSLEEGEAMLQWPASLSAESVRELEDWLALVIRKLKRRVKSDS
jgi:hypothetical protein